MAESGGTVTVMKAPTTFYLRAPILPLITVITPAVITVTWPAPFTDDKYLWSMDDEDIAGRATWQMTSKTAAGMTFQINALISISLGARLFVAGWE